MDAFYEQLDEHRYRSSAMTRGPWSADHQHAGPPSALLGSRLVDALGPGRAVRWTFEILRPVPITELTVTVEVLRPGRKVALGQATLADDDGPVMLARAWRMRESDAGPTPDEATPTELLPPPESCVQVPFFDVAWDEGYHAAVQPRFARGGFTEPGDAQAWLRCIVDVVDGTPITPAQRLLVAADTGNGISARLDQRRWLFVNTDLTVHVRDLPTGEWVGLDATTRFGPGGIGLSTTTLHGGQGPIGTALQSLIVEPR